MHIDDMLKAVIDARRVQRQADQQVGDMLRICHGRLRNANVPAHVLADMKRELRDFNAHTGSWKQ